MNRSCVQTGKRSVAMATIRVLPYLVGTMTCEHLACLNGMRPKNCCSLGEKVDRLIVEFEEDG